MEKSRILLVEDDLVQRKKLDHLLTENSYQVELVVNAEKAIQLAIKNDFDLYILDIDLCEGLDGIGLSKILKSIRLRPIIFISGCEENWVWQKCFDLKPEAILVKPCSNEQILITIERVLHKFYEKNPDENLDEEGSNQHLQSNFFIKDKECYHKVDLANVEKIVSDQGVIHIHLINKSYTYTISSGLKQFQDQFPFEDLQRVNKSCIINLNHLKKFNGNYVWVNGSPISLGVKYKKDFYEKVNVFKTGWKVLSD